MINSTIDKYYDVCIVGGGPAGCATAISLQKLGYSTLVLERNNFESFRIGETLNPAIKPLLSQLGVWDTFLQSGPLPSHGIRSTWGNEQAFTYSHIFNVNGSAWHVNRNQFDKMLFDQAKHSGSTCCNNSRLLDYTQQPGKGWMTCFLFDDNKHTINSQVLVDATGRHSTISSKLGVTKIKSDELMCAAVKYKTTSFQTAHMTTQIESKPNGWWYGAPLPNNELIVAAFTDLGYLTTNRLNRLECWQNELQQTTLINDMIKDSAPQARPKIFPAYSSCVSQVPDMALIPAGDALMSMDPLSGQGVSHAIDTSLQISQAIANYLSGNKRAIQQFIQSVVFEYKQYLSERAEYYQLEQRWPDHPFWQTRQAVNIPANFVN